MRKGTLRSEWKRCAGLGALACALFALACDSDGESDGSKSGTSGTAGTSGTSGASGAGAAGATGGTGDDAGEGGEGGRGDGGSGNDGGAGDDAGGAGSGGEPGDDEGCGDGELDRGEACDDGNQAAGDGCFECAIESGYRCDVTVIPSSCADIDECLEGANDCSVTATCRNTLGSFVCLCSPGLASTDPSCTPPSCDGTDAICGPRGNESCCDSLPVAGGMFYGKFDDLSARRGSYPARVSDFRLDRFEVTVGRFRKFVSAWNEGWYPRAGAGKHVHLNGGEGLRLQADSSEYESGWAQSFENDIRLTDEYLTCTRADARPTYTTTGRANENLPMVCANWFAAYAFCIWDGGFLPSETEWYYAASGGDEERVFPWSNPPTSTNIDCSLANYAACMPPNKTSVGFFSPGGDGRYGQADLAGNVWEFTMDAWVDPVSEAMCDDCIFGPATGGSAIRGGGSGGDFAPMPVTALRRRSIPPGGHDLIGFRCARALATDQNEPPCGDGSPSGSEQCDDGNTVPGDGCFACRIERGFVCDDAAPSRCTDVNECTSGTSGCSANATCTNSAGSFACACNEGYAGNGFACYAVEESVLVRGGGFYRSHDAFGYIDTDHWATVSDFRLDRFEVTVGRFREFLAAWNQGWRPAAGAGKHTHLNGGNGLVDSSATSAYEPGWNQSWVADMDLTTEMLSNGTFSVPNNEYLPITYVNWYEAYAFCIWDGGFLASEAEWNYAASGGDEQRIYPWSDPPTSAAIDCTLATCSYEFPYVHPVGAHSPQGHGKFGQADLARNAWEWVLDSWSAEYVSPCDDCAYVSPEVEARGARGESYAALRYFRVTHNRDTTIGVRCARAPQ